MNNYRGYFCDDSAGFPFMDIGIHNNFESFARAAAEVLTHPECHVNNGPHEARGVVWLPGSDEHLRFCAGLNVEEMPMDDDDVVMEQLAIGLLDHDGRDVMGVGLGRLEDEDEWEMPDTVSVESRDLSHAEASQHPQYANLVALAHMVAKAIDGQAANASEPSTN